MQDLLERLERAIGSDRESDFLIFEETAFPEEYFGSKIESWSRAGGAGYMIATVDGMRHLSAFNAPHYTGSIDAALTLVPDGWSVTINCKTRGRNGVQICEDWDVDYAKCFSSHEKLPRERGKRSEWKPKTIATPAIAICIAALKAHAAITQDKRHD